MRQDYPAEARTLLILNDAAVPLHCELPGVEIINASRRAETLGHKRNTLLYEADTEVLLHWDDDDLYLPWHISEAVAAMDRLHVGMVKPRRAWRIYGTTPEEYTLRPPQANRYEGMLVMSRSKAIALGGYAPMWSGQCKPLMAAFDKEGEFLKYDPAPGESYIYRWQSGVSHISSKGNTLLSHVRFEEKNQDFGDGAYIEESNLTAFAETMQAGVIRLVDDGTIDARYNHVLPPLGAWYA